MNINLYEFAVCRNKALVIAILQIVPGLCNAVAKNIPCNFFRFLIFHIMPPLICAIVYGLPAWNSSTGCRENIGLGNRGVESNVYSLCISVIKEYHVLTQILLENYGKYTNLNRRLRNDFWYIEKGEKFIQWAFHLYWRMSSIIYKAASVCQQGRRMWIFILTTIEDSYYSQLKQFLL